MNKRKMFQIWANGVRTELQVCADDLAKKVVSEQDKDGFNSVMNCLTRALCYCLTGEALLNHKDLILERPDQAVIAGLARSMRHITERTAHSSFSALVLHVRISEDCREGRDFYADMVDRGLTVDQICEQINEACAEVLAERTKEAPIRELLELLKKLVDSEE